MREWQICKPTSVREVGLARDGRLALTTNGKFSMTYRYDALIGCKRDAAQYIMCWERLMFSKTFGPSVNTFGLVLSIPIYSN